MGAQRYQAPLTSLFGVYLVLSFGVRIWWIVRVADITFGILLGIGAFIELYVLYLVVKFIRLARTLTAADRNQLLLLRQMQPGFRW